MAEHQMKSLTALAGTEPHLDQFEGLTIRENPDVAMASLACRTGRDKDLAKSVKGLTGFALPVPGQMASKGDWAAFWTGPGQWMITAAPYGAHEAIAAKVKSTVGDAGSVTEQSDGWVRFELEGPRTVAMLERLCAVDTVKMGAGTATRCQIEHLGSFLLCHEAQARYSLLTLRSGAASMHHALTTAAKSL
ncbi:MAG: sarcosine oxidase, gamma subunit [Paracoccaceae bacterium]